MKKKIILFLILSLLIAAGILIWNVRFDKQTLFIPYFSPPPEKQLVNELTKNNININSLPAVSGNTLTSSISGTTVIFTSSKDFGPQIRALQLVLGGIKMEGKIPKEIDLRFDKVVLRY